MRVNREELLRTLQQVQIGLSNKEEPEQATCLVFKDGRVITFNDEVACSAPTPLDPALTGAVRAEKVFVFLDKLKSEELDVSSANGKFTMTCPGERVNLSMQAEILIPLDRLEPPGDWRPLPKDFPDAVAMVYHCAAHGAGGDALDCVHLHPKWVEASDDLQAARWATEMPLEEPVLVRAGPLKEAGALGAIEVSVGHAWVHFRTATGLVISCRRYVNDFPDLTDALAPDDGVVTAFPKGLTDALDKANEFSKEAGDQDNQVMVELRQGKTRVTGTAVDGDYCGLKPLRYEGPPAKFFINPLMLSEIVNAYPECTISKTRLRVEGGKFTYIAGLGQ